MPTIRPARYSGAWNVGSGEEKRTLLGLEEGRKNTKDEALKKELDASFASHSAKLRQKQSRLDDFLEQTKRAQEYDRTHVFGFNRSISGKANAAAKKELIKQRERDIIKEIRECGIRGEEIHLKPLSIDTTLLEFDGNHINKDRGHGVTKQQAIEYINNASFSVTGWHGEREKYYGVDGVAYVDVKNNVIKTAYSKAEFDDKVKNALEVYSKYER